MDREEERTEHLEGARNASVAPLLASLLCSAMATAMLDTVLGLQIYEIRKRSLDLALLGLVSFAPAAILVFVTGPVADRFDRARVAACALGVEAAIAIALFFYLSSAPSSVGPILGFAFAFGVARAFAGPAVRALPADIVGAKRVAWVVARSSIMWQIAAIVGPVIGAFLYAGSRQLPYIAIMLSALSGGVLLLSVRRPARAPGPPATPGLRAGLNQAVEGLRFVKGHQVVLGAISLDLFAVLFGGAVALLPAIADERLHVGAVGVGWLRAAVGIGASTVTLCLAIRPLRRHVGRTLLAAVALFGIATIVLGLTRTYAVAFVAMLVLAGADAISVFVRATLVPLVTPRSKRGRVLAVENVFIGASNELGAFESGVAGQILGPGIAVVLGGVATLAIAFGWSALFPELRDIDTFPTPVDDLEP